MAHFAEIKDGIVQRVLVVNDADQHRGQDFLANDLGLGGTWIQCSYHGNIRKQYPGIGFTYDPVADVFIGPRPYPSWTLDGKYEWQAPLPCPKPEKNYHWNEQLLSWVAL